MAFSISEFASAGLPYGGARPSYFNVLLETPSGVPNISERMSLTCKAASMPASTLGSIPVRYFGREKKVPGTRIFQPWNVTILNDEDFDVRNALEIWSNLINRHEQNTRSSTMLNNAAVSSTATVRQFSKIGGPPIRSYEFVNIFPTEIGPIELSWDNGEQIEEFTCVFDYDYWKPVAPGTTGSFQV